MGDLIDGDSKINQRRSEQGQRTGEGEEEQEVYWRRVLKEEVEEQEEEEEETEEQTEEYREEDGKEGGGDGKWRTD